ncbi:MAG: DotA/TraY family protein [Gammaproteobacteria bacterium]
MHGAAHAAESTGVNVDDYFKFTDTDQSIEYLAGIFGNDIMEATTNRAIMTDANYLPPLIKHFNVIIFIAGVLVVGYIILVSTINTAHDGTPLGKKYNSPWIVLRAVLGLLFMAPLPNQNYCMAQYFVMWVVSNSIQAADSIWVVFVDNVNKGASPIPSSTPRADVFSHLFKPMVASAACLAAVQNTVNGYMLCSENSDDTEDTKSKGRFNVGVFEGNNFSSTYFNMRKDYSDAIKLPNFDQLNNDNCLRDRGYTVGSPYTITNIMISDPTNPKINIRQGFQTARGWWNNQEEACGNISIRIPEAGRDSKYSRTNIQSVLMQKATARALKIVENNKNSSTPAQNQIFMDQMAATLDKISGNKFTVIKQKYNDPKNEKNPGKILNDPNLYTFDKNLFSDLDKTLKEYNDFVGPNSWYLHNVLFQLNIKCFKDGRNNYNCLDSAKKWSEKVQEFRVCSQLTVQAMTTSLLQQIMKQYVVLITQQTHKLKLAFNKIWGRISCEDIANCKIYTDSDLFTPSIKGLLYDTDNFDDILRALNNATRAANETPSEGVLKQKWENLINEEFYKKMGDITAFVDQVIKEEVDIIPTQDIKRAGWAHAGAFYFALVQNPPSPPKANMDESIIDFVERYDVLGFSLNPPDPIGCCTGKYSRAGWIRDEDRQQIPSIRMGDSRYCLCPQHPITQYLNWDHDGDWYKVRVPLQHIDLSELLRHEGYTKTYLLQTILANIAYEAVLTIAPGDSGSPGPFRGVDRRVRMGGFAQFLDSLSGGTLEKFLTMLGNNESNHLISLASFGRNLVWSAEQGWIAIFVIMTGFAFGLGWCTAQQPTGFLWEAISGSIVPAIHAVLGALWLAGAYLGYGLPMIPYFMFTAAFMGWLVLVIEAMIAAPIFALAFVMPGDQELGKAAPGLNLLAGIFLRPPMMVISLAVAAVLMQVMMALVNSTFQLAMDQMGINSNQATFGSLLPIIAYIVVCTTVISKSFSVITVLPEQIMRWIGSTANTGMSESSMGGEISSSSQGKAVQLGKGASNFSQEATKKGAEVGGKAGAATAQATGTGGASGGGGGGGGGGTTGMGAAGGRAAGGAAAEAGADSVVPGTGKSAKPLGEKAGGAAGDAAEKKLTDGAKKGSE